MKNIRRCLIMSLSFLCSCSTIEIKPEPTIFYSISSTETAPGQDFGEEQSKFFVSGKQNSTVREQKLNETLLKVIEREGKASYSWKDSDYVITISRETRVEESEQVEYYESTTKANFSNWRIRTMHAITNVPLTINKKLTYAVITINIYSFKEGNEQEVWSGTIIVNAPFFEEDQRKWVGFLFQRVGNQDGKRIYSCWVDPESLRIIYKEGYVTQKDINNEDNSICKDKCVQDHPGSKMDCIDRCNNVN